VLRSEGGKLGHWGYKCIWRSTSGSVLVPEDQELRVDGLVQEIGNGGNLLYACPVFRRILTGLSIIEKHHALLSLRSAAFKFLPYDKKSKL